MYILTGNLEALKELQQNMKSKNDLMNCFNISLMLGDVRERCRILAEQGQISLSYALAKRHGLKDYCENLESALPVGFDTNIDYKKPGVALVPAQPLVGNFEKSKEVLDNWPHYDIEEEKAAFPGINEADADQADLEHEPAPGPKFQTDLFEEPDQQKKTETGFTKDSFNQVKPDDWGVGDDDLDLGDDDLDLGDEEENPQQEALHTEAWIDREDPIKGYISSNS